MGPAARGIRPPRARTRLQPSVPRRSPRAGDAVEEGTPGGLEGRIQLHRRYLRDLARLPGVEVRTHRTTLYNSLSRFDQDLMVNGHAYGAPAGHSPVLHLRRVPSGRMWDHYMRSFEAVWADAKAEV